MQISPDDYLTFVDRALDGMMGIIEQMGDLANRSPDLSGANSPYAILVHCVGVCHYWIGTLIAGRHTDRDRPAEFQATGGAAALRAAVNDLKRQIRLDLRNVTPDVDEEQGLAAMPNAEYTPLPDRTHWTQGAVLMHTYEELAQHHGQMQLTRDILVQGRRQI
ncbi:MAG: DUF664 domain-containing protein [Chloroflexi bacterium]|nr:DUF664 domain-containing protein [Chloroflexota bacterium]